jgi:hypothetical protein
VLVERGKSIEDEYSIRVFCGEICFVLLVTIRDDVIMIGRRFSVTTASGARRDGRL